MTKRKDDVSLKVFGDSRPGTHFHAYFDKREMERKAHERAQEYKKREKMGERSILRERRIDELQAVSVRKIPVTLAPLKWGDK